MWETSFWQSVLEILFLPIQVFRSCTCMTGNRLIIYEMTVEFIFWVDTLLHICSSHDNYRQLLFFALIQFNIQRRDMKWWKEVTGKKNWVRFELRSPEHKRECGNMLKHIQVLVNNNIINNTFWLHPNLPVYIKH